jgi:hypothetical protein
VSRNDAAGADFMPILPNTKFPPTPNPIQRIALFLWWAALVVSLLFAGLAVWLGIFSPRRSNWILSAGFSISTWATGRALLFLLTGR